MFSKHADGILLKHNYEYYQYYEIEDQVHETFPRCRVDQIRQINDPHMYGMYLLRQSEMLMYNNAVEERMLYHVTTEKRGLQSLESGLDWRRTKRSKYGRGVSFSDDADYADYYADYSTGEERRVILVCMVLVAKKSQVVGNTGFKLHVPPGSADTTVSPNGRVYVKYNDFEFYPLFMVYYRRKPEDRLKSRYFNAKANNKGNNPFKPLALNEIQGRKTFLEQQKRQNDEYQQQLRRQQQQQQNDERQRQLRRQQQQQQNDERQRQLRRQQQQLQNDEYQRQLRRQQQQQNDERQRQLRRQQYSPRQENSGCQILWRVFCLIYTFLYFNIYFYLAYRKHLHLVFTSNTVHILHRIEDVILPQK